MTAQHTPTPWRTGSGNGTITNGLYIATEHVPTKTSETALRIATTSLNRFRGREEAIANAQFIVTACNCHEELVRVLRYCEGFISGKDSTTDADKAEVLGFARAVLAKVKEANQ